jgi:hypothetical protein
LHLLLSTVQVSLPERDPIVGQLLSVLPKWFQRVGTDEGIAAVEHRLEATISQPLRLFYQFPALACWLRAHHDTDTFLENYLRQDLPVIVCWNQRSHLVLAEFPHSEVICAVELDRDDPQIAWGYEGVLKPTIRQVTLISG